MRRYGAEGGEGREPALSIWGSGSERKTTPATASHDHDILVAPYGLTACCANGVGSPAEGKSQNGDGWLVMVADERESPAENALRSGRRDEAGREKLRPLSSPPSLVQQQSKAVDSGCVRAEKLSLCCV